MMIFCRCCKHLCLCIEENRLKCDVFDINKSRETADAWQDCSRFDYYYRPAKGNLFELLKFEASEVRE